jgi:cell division protein FtsL
MFLNRVNILLAVLLLGCALALVTAQARARKLFVEHERARAQAKQLDVRANELQLQQTQFAKASLIDAKARKEMDMQAVPADRLVHLEQKAPSPNPPALSEGTGTKALASALGTPLAHSASPSAPSSLLTNLSMGGR